MPVLHTMDEATQALQPFIPLVMTLLGTDSAMRRITPLMAAAGNPHEKLKIIHVAGTSGKTSTAYFTTALLQASGQYVGLTVSPHVDSVTERIQINGQPLPEAEFCQELGEFLDIVVSLDEQPSYFELLYSLSFWVFAKRGVEYAVVETGMGGLWDPTNIARRADKVCIITDIGFDHMHVLGNTLPEISAQKAGIIHAGNHVFKYHQTPKIDDVFEQKTDEIGGHMHWVNEAQQRQKNGTFGKLVPDYQQRNWLLAQAAFDYVSKHDNLQQLSSAQMSLTQNVQVPGRMDIIQYADKTIVMDGAHNAQKMSAFLTSFQKLYPAKRPVILLALKEGKEPIDIVPLVAGITDHVILTTFETSQDLPARSIDPQSLAPLFTAAGISNVEVIHDQPAAYKSFMDTSEQVGIITGSFYLLSQLRQRTKLV